jgi:hypothetical protein
LEQIHHIVTFATPSTYNQKSPIPPLQTLNPSESKTEMRPKHYQNGTVIQNYTRAPIFTTGAKWWQQKNALDPTLAMVYSDIKKNWGLYGGTEIHT